MRTRISAIAAIALGAVLLLTGCTGDSAPQPSPTQTIQIDEVASEEVTIAVGEELSIDAGDHPEVYRAIVIDASVAEFVPGTAGSDATNPSLLGVASGESDIVLSDPAGELEDISFTLTVTD